MALNILPANGQDAYNVAILPSITAVASSTGVNDGTGARAQSGVFNGIAHYSAADLFLNVTAASGTSPTLNVYVQKLLADGTTWCDVVSFTQATATVNQQACVVSASLAAATVTDATLAAGSNKLGHMGSKWRIKYTIGGTNPSFTFAVYGNFFA